MPLSNKKRKQRRFKHIHVQDSSISWPSNEHFIKTTPTPTPTTTWHNILVQEKTNHNMSSHNYKILTHKWTLRKRRRTIVATSTKTTRTWHNSPDQEQNTSWTCHHSSTKWGTPFPNLNKHKIQSNYIYIGFHISTLGWTLEKTRTITRRTRTRTIDRTREILNNKKHTQQEHVQEHNIYIASYHHSTPFPYVNMYETQSYTCTWLSNEHI